MNAQSLYARLEKDFIAPEMTDDWKQEMKEADDFLCDNFRKRSMGLVYDFADEITKVYTSVFPENYIMQRILDDDAHDAMLFVHHPCIWDITNSQDVFLQMDHSMLLRFKKNRISIYNLHVPLDHYGEFSTSVTLAKALKINPVKPFAPYFGALAGVVGETKIKSVNLLKKIFENAVGHKVSLYKYGSDDIKMNKVAVLAGGGLDITWLKETAQNNINLYITGITVKNNFTEKAHEFAEKNGISILGGTHYSTEKFACIAMVEYFKKTGLNSEFLEGKPMIKDI